MASLALLLFPVGAFGYGAIAVGKSGEGVPFWIAAFNAKTVADAQQAALKDCATHVGPCEILTFFVNDCVSLFQRQPNAIESVSGSTPHEARERAASQCSASNPSCVVNHAPICDSPRPVPTTKLVPTHTIVPPKVAPALPSSTRDKTLAFIQAHALEIVVVSAIVTIAALIFAATAVFATRPRRD